MNSKKFFDWCRTAVSSIKHWPQKDEIQKDLYGRLEDRYAAFLEKGYTGEESEDKALAAMGDPQEVAAQLAKTYKPIWPRLLIASRVGIVIAIVIALSVSLMSIPLFDVYGRTWNGSLDENRIVFIRDINVSQKSNGYTLTVKRIIYMSYKARGHQCNELEIELSVSHPQIWLRKPYLDGFWAVDNQGNRYDDWKNENSLDHVGVLEYVRTITLRDIPVDSLEYIELHYDCEGQGLVWRIDLSGGDGQ